MRNDGKRVSRKEERQVMVTAGKDKGKTGKVLRINSKTDRVIVEKVNMIKTACAPEPEDEGRHHGDGRSRSISRT